MEHKNVIRENWIYAGLIVLLLTILYYPGLHYPFMLQWDDGIFVKFNEYMTPSLEIIKLYFTHTFQDLYTPFTLVSLMIDRNLFGMSVFGYHLHNLLLHLACALFLFLILRRFGIRGFLAFAGVILWSFNPQKIESVIWITERKDVLSGALAAASFWFFMRNAQYRTVPVVSSFLAALALVSKPSTVALPGVMIVYLLCAWQGRRPLRDYLKLLLLPMIVCAAVLAVSYVITAKNFPGSIETSLLVPLHNIFWYPLTAVFPQVHPFYPPLLGNPAPHWPVFVFGPLMALLLILWGWKAGLGWKKILGWFLIIGGWMVPVLGMLNYTAFDYCDRYNYLVSMAVWGFIVLLCERTFRRFSFLQKAIKAVLLLAMVIYFFLSWLYLPYWEKCEYLFARALEDERPSNIMLYANGIMSAILSDNHQMILSIAQRMIRDHKAYGVKPQTYLFSGNCFALHAAVIRGDYEDALRYYEEIERLYKQIGEYDVTKNYWVFFFRNMAMTAAYHGRKKDALKYLDLYFRIPSGDDNSDRIGYYTSLALKAQLTDDRKLLIHALENIVRIDPGLTRYAEDLRRMKQEDALKK